MKKISKFFAVSAVLLAAISFAGCSQGDDGNDGIDVEPAVLPQSVGEDDYVAGHSFTYDDPERVIEICISFKKDGTFEEDADGKKAGIGRFSYNADKKVVSLAFDKIANSEGKLCTADELLSTSELKKRLGENFNDESFNSLAAMYAFKLPESEYEKYGITKSMSLEQKIEKIKDTLLKATLDAVRDQIISQLTSVYSYKLEPSEGGIFDGKMRLYYSEDTKLTDLMSFKAESEDYASLEITKSIVNGNANYGYSEISFGFGDSYTITDITSTKITVADISNDTKDLIYSTSNDDGIISVTVTYEGKQVKFTGVYDKVNYKRD